MKSKLNVADWLSVSRIVLVPFLLAFILMEQKTNVEGLYWVWKVERKGKA